jgi:hypothetical protein
MPDDIRPAVLRAMGYEIREGGRLAVFIGPPRVSIRVLYWHPERHDKDVRLVEEWLCKEGHTAMLFDELVRIVWPRKVYEAVAFATAAERWAACAAVMRESGLLPKEN